ncbi:MAG: methylated-DNA--[protein]-cysteine S-methyltransferase [Bacteroidota bacterium]
MALSFEEKYEVIGQSNSEYEGIFFTCVKTTGIFCRPSCRARKPKIENVLFCDTAKEALARGFRPCKVCKPLEKEGETPAYISQLIGELHKDPYLKIKDGDLRDRGLDPHQLRRWFKKHHGLTFQAYQRMLRINEAYKQIKGGDSITGAAFGSGYGSLSGFNEGYKNIFGDSAGKNMDTQVINIVRFTTPLGPMFACASAKGLCLLEFTSRKMLETEFKDLSRRLKSVILPGENEYLDQVQEQLKEYFEGKRKAFEITLDTPGTEFQQKVWQKLREIPYGETWSYLQESHHLNQPEAIRAVAQANGANRISIIIPCHRVIASDGGLGGYGGGLARKKWLLEHEQKHSGKYFQGSLDL